MRTTLDLPEPLVKEARRLSGAKTKTQAIIWGLQELVRRKKAERFWDERSKIGFELDLEKARSR